ncbi:MAG: hypothetical protein WA947_18555 [Phormidesmis sp.]
MPSGDSPADRKPTSRTPLKRAIALLSPVLIASLALHGLAMLLPLPEKEEIVEEDLEPPEPIQVSELPEFSIPEIEAAPTPVFTPAPQPESPPIVTPPPAPPPTVIVPSPTPPEILEPLPEPQPEPPPLAAPALPDLSTPNPDTETTQPLPDADVETKPAKNSAFTPPSEPGINYQAYSGNVKVDEIKGVTFASTYGLPEEIATPINLVYEANGKCYEPSENLQAQGVLVFNEYLEASAGQLLKSTGFEDIDAFIVNLLTGASPPPLPDYVFNDIANRESGNIIVWLLDTYVDDDNSLVPEGETAVPYGITFNVTIQENQCG